MSAIERFELPGVGVRRELVTRSGVRVGVLEHHAGGRDLLIFSRDDPDRCADSVRLENDEAHAIASMLGAALVGQGVDRRQPIGGVALDWAEIGRDWWIAGRSLDEDVDLDVEVIAVVRNGRTVPIADVGRLVAADVIVMLGQVDHIDQAVTYLETGP